MLGLTRWSPFGSAFQLHREIDELFDGFFGQPLGGPSGERSESAPPTWWQAVDSYTHEGILCVRVALPGVDPKDVEVTVSENLLTIKGERKTGKETKAGGYFRRELAYGAFERTLTLPDGVDPTRVSAKYTNGMLEVTMPAPLAVAPKKVAIQIEGEGGDRKAIKAA